MRNKNDIRVGNMVESIIGCKWSLSVLRLIRHGVKRPGEMQRQVDGLTTKVLNERLTKLYRFGIIDKEIFPESPPRVEYYFTEFGNRFLEIIDAVERVQNELDNEPGIAGVESNFVKEPRKNRVRKTGSESNCF